MNAERYQDGGITPIIPCTTVTSRDEVLGQVRAIAEQVGCTDYTVLFSTREFKRVPNVRIGENGGGVP